VKIGISDRIYADDEHGSEILARLNRGAAIHEMDGGYDPTLLGEHILEIGAGIGELDVKLGSAKPCIGRADITTIFDRLKRLKQQRPYLQVQYTMPAPGKHTLSTVSTVSICLNVVEHLEDDVQALRNIRDPWGKMPGNYSRANGPGLYGSLDRCWATTADIRGSTARGVRSGRVAVEKVLKFTGSGRRDWWWNGGF